MLHFQFVYLMLETHFHGRCNQVFFCACACVVAMHILKASDQQFRELIEDSVEILNRNRPQLRDFVCPAAKRHCQQLVRKYILAN